MSRLAALGRKDKTHTDKTQATEKKQEKKSHRWQVLKYTLAEGAREL